MLTSRELPWQEWPKLAGTSFDDLWPRLPEMNGVRVLVVEDETGAIVGCWGLIRVWHAEGIWIAPQMRRHPSVGRRLLTGMRRLLKEAGLTTVWTGSLTADVDAMLERVGAYPIPGKAFIWPQGEKRCH
jgi:N-acetylglutamate synthase-like GNAT family acetyltransferase